MIEYKRGTVIKMTVWRQWLRGKGYSVAYLVRKKYTALLWSVGVMIFKTNMSKGLSCICI